MVRLRHVLVVALIVSMVAPALATSAVAQTETCQTYVEHLSFRTDAATVDRVANGTEATSTAKNTRVRLVEDSVFYRVTAENPNGYCVAFRVEVSEDAMPAAQLPGEVESTDGNVTATWDAIRDWNDSETFTRIEFTLGPGETAAFAPNQYRVEALSWSSEQRTRATGTWERVKSAFGDESDVTQRHYEFAPGEKTTITVPLENPQTGESVDEWDALYSTDGDTWKSVPTDSAKPVFVQADDDENAVRFTFNDPDAAVKFVVEPTMRDKASWEVNTYLSGWKEILNGPDSSFGGWFDG
ncbi:hypothetical protein C5C07_20140 [Haloferax sp. Atlit-4N]|uniref:hypothetical protein n=1 Tax=Haloferax sp. Atlit-4N TaxID=2077206 RepID=UPI000E24EC3E|nr:hypothetical protein [Haloferax sp. Atlit-4N]RDZ49694.1 hypothetical protein C5C07_20140 [Haloferax sp. Atlit-4N]